MPWLVRPEEREDPKLALLFVHVPRCGGTSLTKLFKLPQRAREGECCVRKLGLMYFFYRYRLLESANFPWWTYENLLALVLILVATSLFALCGYTSAYPDDFCRKAGVTPYVMWGNAAFQMISSTFLIVAPVVGRNRAMRRFYAFVLGKLLCAPMSSIKWLTGTNYEGWLLHLTAEKIVRYGFVERKEWDRVTSFAIVRNPYSRMVSIWMYNRMGPMESFDTFVRRWSEKVRQYQRDGSTDEWDIYCHVLPMFEYTHANGEQLVQCVIKQEELRSLRSETPAECFSLLPPALHQALLDMPHANKRARPKPWQEYYTESTRDLVLEMYSRDFAQFGYSVDIPKRPDLLPPTALISSAELPTYVNKNLDQDALCSEGNILSYSGGDAPPAVLRSSAGALSPVHGYNTLNGNVENPNTSSLAAWQTPLASKRTSSFGDPLLRCDEDGEVERRGSVFGGAVPIETTEQSCVDWLFTTFLAPVRFLSPVSSAATVDDLHIILTLTLRRRIIWLSGLLLAELAFYLVKLQSLYDLCDSKDRCFPISFAAVSLSLHILLVTAAALVYLEFTLSTLSVSAAAAYLSSVWCLFVAIFTFVRDSSGYDHNDDKVVDNRSLRLGYGVLNCVLAIYYAVYGATYNRAANRAREIMQLDDMRSAGEAPMDNLVSPHAHGCLRSDLGSSAYVV